MDGRGDGLLHVFVPHATAGLAILETGAGSDDDLLAALGDLLPADDRWRHRHGSPGHGRSHVMPALVPPYCSVPGPRRAPRARHLAEHLPGGPQRRQRAARRAVLLPRGLIVVDLCRATPAERAASLPGDELVAADVVMDRGFSLAARRRWVWPWLVQLGKRRAGWYLPAAVERCAPPLTPGAAPPRPGVLEHRVGDVIPDWGGADATFTVAAIEAPRLLLYTSRRGRTDLTWCLHLTPESAGTRVHLRLRLGPVRRQRLAEVGGGFVDALTVAGLAAGLRERVDGHLTRTG